MLLIFDNHELAHEVILMHHILKCLFFFRFSLKRISFFKILKIHLFFILYIVGVFITINQLIYHQKMTYFYQNFEFLCLNLNQFFEKHSIKSSKGYFLFFLFFIPTFEFLRDHYLNLFKYFMYSYQKIIHKNQKMDYFPYLLTSNYSTQSPNQKIAYYYQQPIQIYQFLLGQFQFEKINSSSALKNQVLN